MERNGEEGKGESTRRGGVGREGEEKRVKGRAREEQREEEEEEKSKRR